MAIIPFYVRRPAAILKIPEAIARGLTVQGFIRELTSIGATYRRTLMLADWRSVSNIEARKDVIKYVRRDRLPTAKEYADTEWPWREEWAYKLKVYTQLYPGAPIKDRLIIIESDVALTPAGMEAETRRRFAAIETGTEVGIVTQVTPVGAYRRVGVLGED